MQGAPCLSLETGLDRIAMRKPLGYLLLIGSFASWGTIPVLAFFDVSAGEIVAITTGVFIASEVALVAGILLLGKEAWARIKKLVPLKPKPRDA